MNQVLRQNAKTDVEIFFFKLMNNANFGYDCHKNGENCVFSPISDETEELMFDQSISKCVSSEYLERHVEKEFFNKITRLDPNDEYYNARKSSLEIQKKKELDAVFSMKNSRQKKHKKI